MHPIHPMVVHFPIALLLASILFDVLAFRWRSQQFRDTSFSLLVLGILAAGVALEPAARKRRRRSLGVGRPDRTGPILQPLESDARLCQR